jgi:predicted TIM-barrel fold metal-dependent hydrolase
MIIDVNANLFRWPFRRTPCDEPPRLVAAYLKHGVGQAWVGSLEGLFHRDIDGVNRRLVEACRAQRSVELVPFGSINPKLPDWQEDLRRAAEDYRMPGIRLHPGYHGYRLDEPVFGELLDRAAERRLIVQLVMRMDDVRVQHPLMRIADVNPGPLAELVQARAGLRVVVLNGGPVVRGKGLAALAAVDRIWVEIAMQEGVGGVARLLDSVAPERVLFGSHVPLFALESAVLKMREAGLDDARRKAVERDNAQRLLRG